MKEISEKNGSNVIRVHTKENFQFKLQLHCEMVGNKPNPPACISLNHSVHNTKKENCFFFFLFLFSYEALAQFSFIFYLTWV